MDNPPPPPLDPSLAPVLLFDCGPGGTEPADDENGKGARLVYSIPKRQLLPASGMDGLVDDVNWITPQGWALTLDPDTRCASLHDPFTSRTVRLPSDTDGLLTNSDDTRCVVSALRPTDPGFVVLVIHRTDPVICYCRPGGTQWSRHEYRPELLAGDDEPHNRNNVLHGVFRLVAVGGRFYIHLDWVNKLVTLDFSPDPTLSTSHVVGRPKSMSIYCHVAKLVESLGELFTVRFCLSQICGSRIWRVEVHKLDWSNNTWMKATGLGSNRVFFISRNQFGASISADKVGLKANCIYFTDSDDKGLYVYGMEQGTTTLQNPHVDIPDNADPILMMHCDI